MLNYAFKNNLYAMKNRKIQMYAIHIKMTKYAKIYYYLYT